jgi:hypothetical protein
MTLKTAQTDENAQFKTVGLELYYAPPWAPTTWTRMQGEIDGVLTRRLNAAPMLTLSYMNPRGKRTEDFQIGGRLKLYMGWGKIDSTLPAFVGYITPGGGISRQGYTIKMNAVGYSALLFREQWFEGYYYSGATTLRQTLEGWEAGAAVRELVTSMQGGVLNPAGVVSSNPMRVAGQDFALRDGWQSKGDLVNTLVDEMMDTDIMDGTTRPYYWYEVPERASNVPLFCVRKFPNLADANTVSRTVQWNADLAASSDTVRTEQCTRAIAQSTLDSKLYMAYEAQSSKDRFGTLEQILQVKTTNTDELLRAAYRYVQSHRHVIRVVDLDAFYGIDLQPLMVLDVKNGPFGFEGRQTVTQVKLPIGVAPSSATVTLASLEELITEHTT